MRIYGTARKMPGGLLLGAGVNTLIPEALEIGGFTTALFKTGVADAWPSRRLHMLREGRRAVSCKHSPCRVGDFRFLHISGAPPFNHEESLPGDTGGTPKKIRPGNPGSGRRRRENDPG
jgi:hypothetical protein